MPILDNANFSVPEWYNASSPFSSFPGAPSGEMVSPNINNTSEANIEQSAPGRPERTTDESIQPQDNNAALFPYLKSYQKADSRIQGQISMKYPSNWQEGVCVDRGQIIDFYVNNNGEWACLELFVRWPAIDNLTLSNYLNNIVEGLSGTIRGFELVSQTTIATLNGSRAYHLEYEEQDVEKVSGVPLKIGETGMVSGDRVISIVYSTEKKYYSKYLEDVERIIDSITIETFDSYENIELGIRFAYPPSWNKSEYQLGISLSGLTQDSKITYFDFSKMDDAASLEDMTQTTFGPNQVYTTEPYELFNSQGGSSVQAFNYSFIGDNAMRLYGFGGILTQNNANYFFIYATDAEDYNSHFDELQTIIYSVETFGANRYEKVFDNKSIGVILNYPSVRPYFVAGDLKPIDSDISSSKINFTKNDPRYGNAAFDLELAVFPYDGLLSELDEELKNNLTTNKIYYGDTNNVTIYTNFFKKNNSYKLNFNYTSEENQKIKGVLFYGIHNNFAYLFNFTAEDDYYYDLLLPTVEEIYSSVKLIEFPQYTEFTQYNGTKYLNLNIKYPFEWVVRIPDDASFEVHSPESPFEHIFEETVYMTMLPYDPILSLKERAALDYSVRQSSWPSFSIIESGSMDSWNRTTYYVVSSYIHADCSCLVKEKDVYVLIDDRTILEFVYTAELDKHSSYYYAIAEKILDSIREQLDNKTSYSENQILNQPTGFEINGSPVDLVVNPATNRLYVAVRESSELLIIDGNTDKIINNIPLKGRPNALAVNPITNKIYVASPETDKVYVIDGVTNNVTSELDAGPLVGDLAVDTNELGGGRGLVFVANQYGNTVSVFDDTENIPIGNITLVSGSPYGISLDSVINRAYVTSPPYDVISIINYGLNQTDEITGLTYNVMAELPSQWKPQYVTVDSENSLAFVSNSITNTISVIDSKDPPKVKSTVNLADFFPSSLVYDEGNEALYVSSMNNNSISIVKFGSEGNELNQSRIDVDSVVYDITFNPQTEIIYVANHDAKTVSAINATTMKPTVIATFNVYPSNTTDTAIDGISCKDPTTGVIRRMSVDPGIPIRLDNGTKCTPSMIDESGFVFKSWLAQEREYSSSGKNMSGTNSGIPDNSNLASALTLLDNGLEEMRHEDDEVEVTSYGTYTVIVERKLDVLQSSVGFISVGILIVVSILTAVLYKHIPRVFSGLAKLEVATIIQIDSSAIFGILILLTLSATGGNSPFGSNAPQLWITTLIVIIPFALSAILVMTREKYKGLGTGFMLAGFVILSTSISLIVATALGPSLSTGIGFIGPPLSQSP